MLRTPKRAVPGQDRRLQSIPVPVRDILSAIGKGFAGGQTFRESVKIPTLKKRRVGHPNSTVRQPGRPGSGVEVGCWTDSADQGRKKN